MILLNSNVIGSNGLSFDTIINYNKYTIYDDQHMVDACM